MQLDQRVRSLTILTRLHAALGAALAAGIFGLNYFFPATIDHDDLLLTAASLGTLNMVYFLTIHQVVRSVNLSRSALVMSLVSMGNLALVIISTGGLDSPYAALWPLAIAASGIFGSAATLGMLAVSMLYFFFILFSEGFTARYFTDHLVLFGITMASVGLAEWVHSRTRKIRAATSKLETLSGQLSAEQLKAEAIMGSIAEGVMVVDGSRRIQLFNKAAQDLAGWDESSAQGIDYNLILQLKTSDERPINELNDPITQAWRKHAQVIDKTLIMTTHRGRKIQLNISVSPIFDSQDQPSGAIALFRDISAEKEVERQKDEFVSTASHEMRTPVAAIEGYISLAMNPNVATIDDRARKYLEKAHETIAHLGELFRDLLSVTKAEENQLGGRIEAVDLNHLLQGAVDDMQFIVKKKGLTLVYQIGESGGKSISPLYYVAANPERLREVVMNLIDNSNKFTNDGGIKVVLSGNIKEVTVSVSDSGLGISREDSAHLFQKFYRIDSSATRTIGGTGLGLYLCRRLIELFNGRIWVESRPGEGSTFKFTLPRLTEEETARLMAQSAQTSAASPPPAMAAPAVPSVPILTPVPGVPVSVAPPRPFTSS
ncbi:MAG: hypothetical protein NVSMB39_4550 [Candidatus Saccharimonadales bacterium]